MTAAERKEKIEKIRSLPGIVAGVIAGLNDAQLQTPYRPGGWTPRQVVHHLADSHMNAFIRMKLILTENNPTLKPYDQDTWAKLPDTAATPLTSSLALLKGLHDRWFHLLEGVNDDQWSRKGVHPENGDVTLESLLSTYAMHGEKHVGQILSLRKTKEPATLPGDSVLNEQVLRIFKESGALLDGHFQLTSGLHSPQYFQCAKVLQYPRFANQLCNHIAAHFSSVNIQVVIAPALGGIVVGQEVGRLLGARTIFAERKDGVMQLRRGFEVLPQERVLVCEDVVTTGGSVFEVINSVRSLGGQLLGVGYLVDRSGGKVKFDVDSGGTQFSLLKMDVVTHQPDGCPMCRQGIPIEKPGSRSNPQSQTNLKPNS